MENPFKNAPVLKPRRTIKIIGKKIVRQKRSTTPQPSSKTQPTCLVIDSVKEKLEIHKETLKEFRKQAKAIQKQQALINKLCRQKSEELDRLKRLIRCLKKK